MHVNYNIGDIMLIELSFDGFASFDFQDEK